MRVEPWQGSTNPGDHTSLCYPGEHRTDDCCCGCHERPAKLEPVEGVPFDWHDDGVLWLVNRVVFHPRGFALAHTPGTDRWLLLGDGSETWRFVPGEKEDELFAKVEALLARARATHFDFEVGPT
jgi:hypothetical protein